MASHFAGSPWCVRHDIAADRRLQPERHGKPARFVCSSDKQKDVPLSAIRDLL